MCNEKKIEADRKHIAEREKQYHSENKKKIPKQQCKGCYCMKLEDSFKQNTDGQLFKTCITCMESEQQYRERNKDTFQAASANYYIINKEKKIAQSKEWRELNKERLSESIMCGCGGKFKYCDKSKHVKGKKHIAWALGSEEAN